MELLKPEIGLIYWTVLCLLYFILLITALVSVMRNDFHGGNSEKWMWLVLIIVLPFIGSIVYLLGSSTRKISK